ncbi:MAG TPA: AMP-binding protein [Dissulfurispiraceae bacterium]|nr:AMP-binding protein [Dissulfurispiraceae bacterium]
MLLHHQFIRTARRFGEKTAFIDRSTDKRMTYAQMLIASIIFADKLKRFDKGYIGIMLPTSAGCALSNIAALMSGRVPVMINYATGAARNAVYAQEKCGFRTIVTSKALLQKIDCPEVNGMIYVEDIVESISAADKLIAAAKAMVPLPLLLPLLGTVSEDETAVILFTSGSEKDPKAVELTHRNISSNIEGFSRAISLSDKDVMLAILPFFHVFGLTVNLWTPLFFGMSVVSYANPLDFKAVCSIIREEHPTLVIATPSFLAGYLRKSETGDFASVRLAIVGADRCPDPLREEFHARHGLPVLEGYGTTETAPVISVNAADANKPGSVGKPIPGVQVRIQHLETDRGCTVGELGRILVKGDNVMKGYLDDLEETSIRIHNRWYDTGDMGYLDPDGYLWHAGRLRRFVKIGGEMVSLVQVEHVLEKLLPEGIACCVVDVPDQKKGARIIAVVTDSLINEKQLLKDMAKQLPPIALPKEFMVISELPKMGSGKIDFRGVSELVVEKVAHAHDKKR